MPTVAATVVDRITLLPFESMMALAMIAVAAVCGLAIYAVLTVTKGRGSR